MDIDKKKLQNKANQLTVEITRKKSGFMNVFYRRFLEVINN